MGKNTRDANRFAEEKERKGVKNGTMSFDYETGKDFVLLTLAVAACKLRDGRLRGCCTHVQIALAIKGLRHR